MDIIITDKAPAAIGSYSQAVKVDNIVYLSGQIGLDEISMQLVSESVELQIDKVIDNIQAVCKASGGDLSNLVKINVYLTDLANFSLVNIAMEKYFVSPYPARALVEVSALPKGAKVEMDAIMALPVQQTQ
ncbi:MAG: Rid family detoxifying hydrolase [Legionellaceae bacterium]|nr:Rid family detoxifying hydrolase [Legionellaceae bacterium]